ncbi:MAG: autotransporter domain-containing protein, partial [Bacteroidota bacterium]
MFRRWAFGVLATLVATCCVAAAAWCGPPPADPVPGSRDLVQWRDYDGDGDQDFVLLRHEDGGDLARVFRNDGGGVFNAVADCVTDGGVITCEGDQSAGISIESCASPIQLWVQNLEKDVTPGEGTAGIDVEAFAPNGTTGMPGMIGNAGGAGLGIEVHFAGPDRAIVTQGEWTHGIYAFSVAGDGGNGGVGATTGGSGGDGAAGGAIGIESDATITVSGHNSYGIDALSFGGTGGMGSSGLTAGSGGAGGKGGDISITSKGAITATGVGAGGIVAKSYGEPGGRGGSGFMGADGGAGGDGGDISITNQAAITTRGEGSYGMLAQSLGAGGGAGGHGSSDGADGRRGDGGTVAILGKAAIQTEGNESIGILAVSESASSGLEGTGQGGTVTVDQTGGVTAKGEGAYGIVAESVAHGGAAGDVSITVDGNVTADGTNSRAIVGVSSGDAGAGRITMLIKSGTVRGSAGSGTAVTFVGGTDNVLENHGTIDSKSGLGGMAILGGSGNETIENFGTTRGLVDLGSGNNTFDNNAGALFEAGTYVKLGEGGTLVNSGVLSPGGASVATTTIEGNFVQNADGTLSITVGKDVLDKLIVTGSVNLDGTLSVHPGHDAYLNGTTYDIIESPDVTGAFSKISSTAFLNFETQPAEGGVQLKVDVRPFASASTSQLQQAIASCLDQCILHATGDYSHMIGQFQIASADQVAEAFYSLSPGPYDNLTRGAILSAQLHQDDLLQRMNTARSRPSPDGVASTGRAYEEGGGWWVSGSYLGADQNASGGFFEQTFTTTGARGGYESAMGRGILGASAGYLHSKADLGNDQAHGLMKGYVGSLYGGHLWGRSFAQAVASFLSNKFDNRRALHVGSEQRVATSQFDGTALTGLLTGGTRFPAGRWGIEPYGALRYAHLSEDGFAETGAGSVNLTVDKRKNDWLASDLGVRFNATFQDEG